MSVLKQCNTCQRAYATEADFLRGTSRWRICSKGNLWFNCSCNSTLMVPKGKYDWYSPEKVLRPEVRGVFNTLGGLKDLPHIPSIVSEIQLALADPNVSPKKLAGDLRHEPMLGMQILQIAENLRNSRNPTTAKITSLEHAIVYIGFKSFGDVVLTSALRTFELPPSDFQSDAFWRESYLTGLIAERLMQRAAIKANADEVFLAASLCNLGKLLTAFCFPPLATKIERDVSAPTSRQSWRQAEAAYGFPDHCILGEIAASLWGFPSYVLTAAMRHHNRPTSKPPQDYDVSELVAVANQMLHWIMLRPHRMEYAIVDDYARRYNLSDKDLDLLAQELTRLREVTTAAP